MSVLIPPDLLALIPPKYRAASTIGNSESEIERWKADRRRNFPTELTISRKRARESSREASGELREAHPTGSMRRAVNPRSPLPLLHSNAPPSSVADPGQEGPPGVEEGPPGVEDEPQPSVPGDEAPEELPVSREAHQLLMDGPSALEDTRLGIVPSVSERVDSESGVRGGSGVAGAAGRPLCAAFKANGRCRFGSSCHFSHALSATVAPPGSLPAVCRWYLLGVCTAGKRCPYQHAQSTSGVAPSSSSSSSKGAEVGGESKSLLRRLFARDIQRETSMLLQSIRFLVQQQHKQGPGSGSGASDE